MIAPIISCICLEYGRPAQVSEAVACFLAQTGDVPAELILLNSCPQIQYEFSHERVKVINLSERPSSLGATRNRAIEAASGRWIATWDSDDHFAPWHLKTYAERFAEGVEWVWVDRFYYAEAGRIKSISQNWTNTIAFTKTAWEKAGGYRELNVGEDADFAGRLTSGSPGVRAALKPEEISYIYNWGTGVYHISGMGKDKPGQTTAWQRSKQDLERRIRSRTVKTGKIMLTPSIKVKPEDKIREFIKTNVTTPKASVCLVILGRFGDVINVLPIARRIAELHAPPAVMVSREFASVLDGVSYVVPHVVDPPYSEVGRAMDIARKSYPNVVRCQIWGKNHVQERKTESYNMESWREAGMLDSFFNPQLTPVFDRRDLVREQAIFHKLADGRPLLLLKLQGGLSSPFASGAKFEALLRERFSATHQVVELASLKFERIYDMLGLMDRAAALVTIDTSTLHLAAASGVPVVTLVNSTPWLGTMPRCRCVARLSYEEAERSPETVINRVHLALRAKPAAIEAAPIGSPQNRKLIHCCERHEEARCRRKEAAQSSWDALYQRGVIPAHYWKYARDARGIGDRRALPYLKDVLAAAMEQAASEDVIFFTNDDNTLHPSLIPVLSFHVAVYGACSSRRCEFRGTMPQLDQPPSEFARRSLPHIGRDLFAFTKAWLVAKWSEIPDFILGASEFDLALACMIRLEKGVRTTRRNIGETIWPCELETGLVSHAYHHPAWQHPMNESRAASQVWNRRLFREWAARHLPELAFDAHGRI